MKKYYPVFFWWLLLLSQSFSCVNQLTGKSNYSSQKFQLKDAVDRIDDFLLASGATGSILIGEKENVLLRKGYGWADEKQQIPLTTSSVFDIGSVTKQFTATAILKLEEQGKLNVTDSITRFFKNVPPDKQNITVHELLTHTAGFDHDVLDFRQESGAKAYVLNKILNSKLKFEPNKKYSYSNAGYVLLAMIIEMVSGRTYEEYLFNNLFKPAQMMKTGFLIPNFTKRELALGYDLSGELGTNQQWWDKDGPSWATKGAGAILSNLEDLYKWHVALAGQKILTNKLKQKLFTSYVSEDDKDSSYYSYGWAVFNTERGTKLITHDGFGGIFYANFLRYTDEDIVIIYFTNERSTVSKSIFGIVPAALFSNELPVFPRSKMRIAEADLNKYTGSYQLPSGDIFTLYINQNNLEVKSLDSGVANLLTKFPELQETGRITTTELQTKDIVENIARGNFDSIRNSIVSEENYEAEKKFWTDKFIQWTNRFGKYKKTETIGSVQDSTGLLIYNLLQFEHGSTTLQFKEMKDKRFYIGTVTRFLPSHYRFIPKSMTEFEVFNYSLKTSTPIEFTFGPQNTITGIVAKKGNIEIRARKL